MMILSIAMAPLRGLDFPVSNSSGTAANYSTQIIYFT